MCSSACRRHLDSNPFSGLWRRVQARSTFESDEKQNQIDNEQQHNGRFEDQHQAIGLVVLEQLIQVVERLEFFVDRPVPIAQMKAGGDVLVNSREVPIAEEFGDVGEFIAEPGEIDPDFAQLAQHIAFTAQGFSPKSR